MTSDARFDRTGSSLGYRSVLSISQSALSPLGCGEVGMAASGKRPASLRRGTVGVDLVHPVMIRAPAR